MSDETGIYARQGLGTRMGFGSQPALLVIDFSKAFNDPDVLGGGNIQSAIDHSDRPGNSSSGSPGSTPTASRIVG